MLCSKRRLFQSRTRASLEQAKQQLEEAHRREADQLRIIQMLERENRQWKEKQRQISNGIMSNSQHMADLNDIARHGAKSPRCVVPPHETSSVVCSIHFTLLSDNLVTSSSMIAVRDGVGGNNEEDAWSCVGKSE